MKIALVSDLHLSVTPYPLPQPAADVLILAGDIGRPGRAMEWARSSKLPTIYVAGNHEFYGSDLSSTYEQLRQLSQGTNVRVLERSEWIHKGVRFLGCTLWSDYRLFEGERRDKGIEQSSALLHDFSRIKVARDFPDTFSPATSQLLFLESVAWLEQRFSEPFGGDTVVVTHFAPSTQSVSSQFVGSLVNASFVSDLEAQIKRWRPTLWIHGHTHDSFDYTIGRTRVVCNARGYAKDGKNENSRFDSSLIIDLNPAKPVPAERTE